MKSICIIPARGGSKRIPKKNIKNFLGKPIIAYSIETALESGLFDEVMVSTDDEEIAEVAKKYGAKVPFLRSEETSNDNATMEEAITEVIHEYKKRGMEFDHFFCLFSTVPFIDDQIVLKSYDAFISSKATSLVPVVRYSYPIQRALVIEEGLLKMREPQYIHSRSQDLTPTFHDAGMFYWMKINDFIKQPEIFNESTAEYEIREDLCQDIDTLTDWEIAEMKYRLMHRTK